MAESFCIKIYIKSKRRKRRDGKILNRYEKKNMEERKKEWGGRVGIRKENKSKNNKKKKKNSYLSNKLIFTEMK